MDWTHLHKLRIIPFVLHNTSRSCLCCVFNARSIVNKLCELHYVLYSENYDIVCITETWLHSNINSGLLDPRQQYHITRKDRSGSQHGGGVAIFVKRDISLIDVAIDDEFTSLELLCIDLSLETCILRFFVVYRPPNTDQCASLYTDLLVSCLKRYSVNEQQRINIVVGDLNCPKIDWTNLHSSGDYINQVLLNWAITGGYSQFVNFPTRGDNILDVVLADDDQIISWISAGPPIGHGDHCTINFKLVVDGISSNSSRPHYDESTTNRYNWHRADYDAITNCLLCIDWDAFICHYPDAKEIWSAFSRVLWSAVDRFVPKSAKCMSKPKCTYPREIRKLCRQKKHLWKKCRSSPDNLQKRWEYRDCTNTLRSKCRELVKQQEENIVRSNNLGLFYRYVNSRVKYRRSIGALIDDNGAIVTSDTVKANMFNEYYASIGILDDNNIPSCPIVVSSTLETVSFSETSVVSAINKLKSNLSSGPDGLPPVLFKRLKYCLARPLSMIFTQLMSVGTVPHEWTEAIIVPIFKKGAAGSVSNYRPISLTCVVSKIMERIVVKCMYEHLMNCEVLSNIQHGFVKGRSTCTNLLECVNDWTLAVQNKQGVTIAYIDFARAFDTVSHKKLIVRLFSYGIRGALLQWIEKFFENRTHQTRVGQCLSGAAHLLSGVVQGSGIGPMMFLIFIDELAKLLECHGVTAKLFADDVKVYLIITTVDDVAKLQGAINLITDWAREWQLQVSVNKCNLLNIGHVPFDVTYHINGSSLSYQSNCRDLGVIITHDLSPSIHISEIVAKAHQRANIILRCFMSNDKSLLLRVFLVYVRPILEYCSVVWWPCTKKDTDCIEKVQRQFKKRLPA